MTPNAIILTCETRSPTTYVLAKEWHEQAEISRICLDITTKNYEEMDKHEEAMCRIWGRWHDIDETLTQQFKSHRKCTRGWWEDMKVPSQSSNVWERYLPSTTSTKVQNLSSLSCERSQTLSRRRRWPKQKQVQLCTNNCSHLQW